jgi:FlaG/FlaF family flagellin (archaellin)
MEFSNRNVQPQAAAPGAQNTAAGNFNKKNRHDNGKKGELSRIITVILVAAVAILIAAVIAVMMTGNNVKSEDKYVDSGKLQAVFLNTGQVYFGHIKSLNNKYFVVTDIYYLQTSNSSSSTNNSANNVTLVKLGCELHEPYDQMIVNSDQVTFWENLQDNGQVAKAVSTFQKQNPNGQKCADQSSSASSNSSNNAQNAGSNSTTPATKP